MKLRNLNLVLEPEPKKMITLILILYLIPGETYEAAGSDLFVKTFDEENQATLLQQGQRSLHLLIFLCTDTLY